MKRERVIYWLGRVAWWLFCASALGWAFYEAVMQPLYDPATGL